MKNWINVKSDKFNEMMMAEKKEEVGWESDEILRGKFINYSSMMMFSSKKYLDSRDATWKYYSEIVRLFLVIFNKKWYDLFSSKDGKKIEF